MKKRSAKGSYVFTDEAAKLREKRVLFLAFSVSHTRLGRGARDWGETLTTLVIHRTDPSTLSL